MTSRTKKKTQTKKDNRNGKPKTEVVHRLLLQHGGRCAICNRWLADDPHFFLKGNYMEVAHIIAASKKGPRGEEKLSRAERHSIENLIPLCRDDHKTVDGPHKNDFTVERLRSKKLEHAQTIQNLCNYADLPPSLVLRCQAHIGGTKVAVTHSAAVMALRGKRPHDRDGLEIDFSTLSGSEAPDAINVYAKDMDEKIKRLLSSGATKVSHVSIFAIGPIPLLVSLGSSIGRAMPTDYFHRKSSTSDWGWKEDGTPLQFEAHLIQKGTASEVGILISCTGSASIPHAKKHLSKDAWIFEIRPIGVDPRPDLIDHPQSVSSFIDVYNKLRADIYRNSGDSQKLHLFLAAPPSIAVATGQHLFAKVDPPALIYDFRKQENGFVPILEVNQ